VVRTKFTLQRSAFTMIELIFAIVIIGITVISLPMMTQAVSKGMESNLAQEAIFAASAELNQVLSHKWDVDSQESIGELTKVIPTSSVDCNISNGLQRPGHVHRMCLNGGFTSLPTIDGVGEDSIDGNQVTAAGVEMFEAGDISDASGYKNRYTMNVAVGFSDFGGSSNNNMKEITVTVKQNENPYVVLKTYSANIGETEAAKRVF
jgi:prepilin-type N-terminal cleavage/methylation domain-containing protein